MSAADHRKAQTLAQDADIHMRKAMSLYAEAAELEARALASVPPDKPRTFGILAVSVAALWYKARRYDEAIAAARDGLKFDGLRPHARFELLEIIAASEKDRAQ